MADRERELTPLEELQPLLDVGRLAGEGLEDPGPVQPLFEQYDPTANVEFVNGIATMRPLEEQGAQFADYKNFLRNVIPQAQALPSPVSSEIVQGDLVKSLGTGFGKLKEQGIPTMLEGTADEPLGETFFTQTEWWSFNSGLTLEHVDMWEAQQAMYAEAQEAIADFETTRGVSIERMRMNQVWLTFDDEFGAALGPEWIDAMAFTFNRNIDEERMSALFSEMGIALQNRPDWLRSEDGKAEFLMYFLQRNAQLSQEHMIETEQIDPDPAPGLFDVFKGLGGAAVGVFDLLPEERLGFDVSGEIVGGFQTTFGGLAGAPIVGDVLGAAGFALRPIDEYVVDPLRRGVSESFATRNFLGFDFGLDADNPYRAYLTPGQNLAISMGHDPGTDWFKNVSGAADLMTYFAFDPLTFIAPMAKGHSLSKVKAASVMDVGTTGARLRSVGKALIPGKAIPGAGRNMALGWTGMKGPLTRAYYYATAQTADDLIRGSKQADKFFTRMYGYVAADNIAGLVDEIPDLDGTRLLDQFAVARSVDEVKEIWLENLKGMTNQPTARGAVEANLHVVADRVGATINEALESGTIGPRDLAGMQWGSHKYDGLLGIVDNGDGTFSKRRLTGGGGEVFVWTDGNTRFANVADIRRMVDAQRGQRVPSLVRKLLDESQARTGQEMQGIWSAANGNARNRALQWMEANGYGGFHFGDRVFMSNQAQSSLIRATDIITDGVPAVLGPQANEYLKAKQMVDDLRIAPEPLDWIIDLPARPSVFSAAGGALRRYLDETFDPRKLQPIRRFQQRWTRAGKQFPTSVNVADWQRGAREFRQIANRLGIDQGTIDGWVEDIRRTPRAQRFEKLAEIRALMLDEVGNWRYRHGIAGGTFIDEGEILHTTDANGGMIAPGRSRSRDMDVSIPYTPSLLSDTVPFWSETFYDEMRRLDAARSRVRGPLIGRSGFVSGTREARKGLAERYRRLLEAKGIEVDDFLDQDLYNMAFAQLTGDDNGLGLVSRASQQVSRWYKGFHSQFSLMALALRPVGWLTKVVIIEEPIRAAIGGLPSWTTNPFRAVRDIFDSGSRSIAARNAELLPEAMQTMRRTFDGIVAEVAQQADTAGEQIARLVDQFGDDIRQYLPSDLQVREGRAFIEIAEEGSDVDMLGRMSRDDFVARFADDDALPDAIQLPPEGMPAPTNPLTGERFPDGTHAWFPDDIEAPLLAGDQLPLLDPTFVQIKNGNVVGQLIVTVGPDGIEDFLITTTKAPNARGAAVRMVQLAVEEMQPLLGAEELAELVLRGGPQGTGITLSSDGARFAHSWLSRQAAPLPEGPLTFSQMKFATDELLKQYASEFNLTLNGRISLSTQVRRQVNRINRQRTRVASPWSDPARWGLDDLENIGRSPDGTAIYSQTLFDEVTAQFDSDRVPVTRGRGADTQQRYARGYVSEVVGRANDPWVKYTANRMLNNRGAERIQDFINRASWHRMRDNVRRIAAQAGTNVEGWSDLKLATWYFDTWAPKNVVGNLFREFWTEGDEINHARRIEVLRGIVDGEIILPNGARMPLGQATEASARRVFESYLEEGYAAGHDFKYLPQTVVGEVNFRSLAPDYFGFLDKPNQIMSRVVELFGPKASEAVTREPGWVQVYQDYVRHYTGLGWDDARADAAARIKATHTINDLMYNVDAMSNWRVKYNQIMPFGAAQVEVMEVWFKNLPRDNIGGGGPFGWLVGTAFLDRKVARVMQGLEAVGLVERDEDNERYVVAERAADRGTPLGDFISGGLFEYMNLPTKVANLISPIADAPEPEQFRFNLGDPLRLDSANEGLFAINRLSFGLSPVPGFLAHELLERGNIIGQKEGIEIADMRLTDVLEELDLSFGEFLADPQNRVALRNNGIDLDDVADDQTLFELGVNPVLSGKFYRPASGFWQQAYGDIIYPYGAPQSFSQAVGQYVPGSFQALFRGLDNQFGQSALDEVEGEGTSITDFIFGPIAAYQTDATLIQAMMYDNARNGSLDEWERLQTQVFDLRVQMVEDGVAVMLDRDPEDPHNDRFGPNPAIDDAELDPRWVEIAKLQAQMADQEEIVIEAAHNIAAGADFARAATMFLAPTSPRIMHREQIEQGEFWASVDFGESIRRGEGSEAYTRWLNTVRPRSYTEMAGVVLSFLGQENEFGLLDPNVSRVKQDFVANNPHLELYLTPSKIYSERWRDTESVDAFFAGIQEGTVEFAEPEVYLMRHFSQQLSWQQGAEREAFFSAAPMSEGGKYALENWEQYQDLQSKHKVERDYLKFYDVEEFGGQWSAAKDAIRNRIDEGELEFTSLTDEVEQLRREERLDNLKLLQGSLSQLIDDIDSYELDPTEEREVRSVLYSLRDIQRELIETASELDQFGAFSPQEAQLSAYFDAIYSPFTEELGGLYTEAFGATNKRDRSLAFDNIRTFANLVFYSNPALDGVSYPNPIQWQLDIKSDEEMELKALRSIGKKVEWLHAGDVEAIRRSSPSPEDVDKYLPRNLDEWIPYHTYNEVVNRLEESRLLGLISDSEANKLKDAAEERLNEVLVEAGLQSHLDFQADTPAGQLRKLGMLEPILFEFHDHAELFLQQAEAIREAGGTGIDDLWRQEYWRDMEYYLSNDPNLRRHFEDLIMTMYGEVDWLNGARKLFLGKFGPE